MSRFLQRPLENILVGFFNASRLESQTNILFFKNLQFCHFLDIISKYLVYNFKRTSKNRFN